MGNDDLVPEAFALEDFYFDGITNLFVAGSSFHVTFWTWQQTEAGLLRFGIKRGVCPANTVPESAEKALAALARAAAKSITDPFMRVLS